MCGVKITKFQNVIAYQKACVYTFAVELCVQYAATVIFYFSSLTSSLYNILKKLVSILWILRDK